MLLKRIQIHLDVTKTGGRVFRISDEPQVGNDLATEIESRIRASAGIIVIYSFEGAGSYWLHYELYTASRLGKPACFVSFPMVPRPAWMTDSFHRVDLVGVRDNGPALAPGTDEGQFFRRSAFVGDSLAEIESFVNQVADGKILPMPAVPKPDPKQFPGESPL